jgi:hypothetical protein
MTMTKFLFPETITVTPHTETGLELCHIIRNLNENLVYCPLFMSLQTRYWGGSPGGVNTLDGNNHNIKWVKYISERIPNGTNYEAIVFSQPRIQTLPTFNTLRTFEIDGFPFGELIVKFMGELLKNANWIDQDPDNASHSLSQRLLHDAITTYIATASLISRHRPDTIVFFNGRTPTTQPILWLCERFSLEPLIHERGPNKHKYELYSNQPSRVETIGENIYKFSVSRSTLVARDNASRFYSGLRNGTPNYWASFITHQSSFEGSATPFARNSYLCFFLSSLDELESITSYSFDGAFGTQLETLLVLHSISLDYGMPLVVRAHPYQEHKKSEMKQLLDICMRLHIHLIEPNSTINSLRLGLDSLKSFTFTSQIAWELMYWGKRVGVLGKSVGNSFRGVEHIASIEDLRAFIMSDDWHADPYFPIIYGDYMTDSGYYYRHYMPHSLGSGIFPTAKDALIR